MKGRLKLSDAERATLGEIGHRVGRKVLAEVATVWPYEMTPLRRLKFSGLAAGPVVLLVSLNVPALAQTVTIDAFIDYDGKKIPTICLISNAPPKDLCGPILQGLSVAQFQSLRGTVEQQMEQKSRILLQQQNK